MDADARRCYVRAVASHPSYVLRPDVTRHMVATLMTRRPYQLGEIACPRSPDPMTAPTVRPTDTQPEVESGVQSPERHARLRAFMRHAYRIRGVRTVVRNLVRLALQRSMLPHGAKQRLFNFFARDVAVLGLVPCQVEVPGAGRSASSYASGRFEQELVFLGYAGFEPALTGLFRRLLESKTCVFDVGANVATTRSWPRGPRGAGRRPRVSNPSRGVRALVRNAGLNTLDCLRLNEIALSDSGRRGSPAHLPEWAWTNASLVAGHTPSERESAFSSGVRHVLPPPAQPSSVWTWSDRRRGEAELSVLRGIGHAVGCWRPDILLEVLKPYADGLDSFFRDAIRNSCHDLVCGEITRLSGDAVFRTSI